MEELLNQFLNQPEMAKEIIPVFVEKYKPTVYAVCKEILKVMQDYVNNDEVYEAFAIGKKKQFDAYMNVGFTEDQAIAFMINDNIKLMKSLKQATSSSTASKTSK